MFKGLINIIHFSHEKRKWRACNAHNLTSMENRFNVNLVHVGNYTYGGLSIINHSDTYQLIIGNYCSIGPDVLFVVCGDHETNHISTYPFKVRCKRTKFEAHSKGDIVIEDDVWIGARATILSGVRIGQGSVISAGAIVVKDVEPYSIVAGVPAKTIRKRCSEQRINELLNIDFSRLDINMINDNIDLLYDSIDNADISWLPRKTQNETS